ncbi:MAG: hypothetical protein JRK26_17900 [Deltaproteobacteria bacterium]|nr:hypothetical protein [Deltaproteobacteria bacterium]
MSDKIDQLGQTEEGGNIQKGGDGNKPGGFGRWAREILDLYKGAKKKP